MANFTVTTLDDTVDAADGLLSLREAVLAANADADVDQIYFDLSLQGGTLRLSSLGEIVLTESVQIFGSSVTIDANADGDNDVATFAGAGDPFTSQRAFRVGGTVELYDLILTGGRVSDQAEGGGAIYVDAGAQLSLLRLRVQNNSTVGAGGSGGGIGGAASSTILINESTITANRTEGMFALGGGIAGGYLGITRSTIANNVTLGAEADGGGIAGVGTGIRIYASTIVDNLTSGVDADGGGVFQGSGYGDINQTTITGNVTLGGNAQGGGIAQGAFGVNIFGSIVTGNLAASAIGDDITGTHFAGASVVGDSAAFVFATTKLTSAGGRTTLSGELFDNGGSTATAALRSAPDNPALDLVFGYGAGNDQRGEPLVDALPGRRDRDAGAFELQTTFGPGAGDLFIVTTTADTLDSGDGVLSLREALELANADPNVDTIVFDAALAGQTIHLDDAELVIEQSVTIDGTGGIIIDANADGDNDATTAATGAEVGFEARRAFRVASSTEYGATRTEVTFANLTITGGRLVADGSDGAGGGVFGTDGASLRFVGSTVRGNSVAGSGADGGGVAVTDAFVGGFVGPGTVIVEGGTISGNSASGDGGGIHGGDILLTNATLADNLTGGNGGGVAATNSVTLQNTTITANAAASFGGVFTPGGSGIAVSNSLVLGNVAADGNSDIASGYSVDSILGGGDLATGLVFAATRSISVGGNTALGGLLADNGGPTHTVALRANPSNPALDAANGNYAPEFDQRGEARFDSRPGVGLADIGAFELTVAVPDTTIDYTLVTTAADGFDLTDTVVTLREAIEITGITSDVETIRFAATLDGATLSLTQGELVIDRNTIAINGDIDGDGKADITIDANADRDGNAATRATGAEPGFIAGRAFLLDGVSATLTALTITGGRTVANGDSGGGIGVRNADLTLVNSHVTGNSTTGADAGGGGIGVAGSGFVLLQGSTISGNSTSGSNAPGGGMRANSISATNTTVADNHTTGQNSGGGGLSANGNLFQTTVTGNTTAGSGSAGGGIAGNLRATNSVVSGNLAALGGGDEVTLSNSGANSLVGAAAALLVFANTTTLTVGARSTIAGVLADSGGPAPTVALRAAADNPALDRATIPSAPTDQRGVARFDAFAGGGIGDIGAYELAATVPGAPFDFLTVTTLADTVNASDGLVSLREAVAFADMTAEADTIRFAPGLAGGVVSLTQGALVIARSLIIDGDVTGDDKADITVDANADGDANAATRATGLEAGFAARSAFLVSGFATVATFQSLTITGGRTTDLGIGGGVHGGVATTLIFNDSTITGNSTANANGGGVGGYSVGLNRTTVDGNSASGSGGGVAAVSLLSGHASTIAANQAGASGGGAYAGAGAFLSNFTITGNTAATGGGLRVAGGGTALTNSLIAGNLASGTNDDLLANNPTLTTSLIGGVPATLFAATTTITAGGRNGMAGVLADNGGPTRTVATGPNSATIDTGTDDGRTTDQRGFPRFDARAGGGTVDIGAFEYQGTLEAGSLIVTTAVDVIDSIDGLTSLREAVLLANASVAADTITFAATLAGATLHLTQGQIAISNDITINGDIDGDRRADITIDANADGDSNAATRGTGGVDRRAFDVTVGGTDTRFESLTITGGRTSGDGGAIRAAVGTLTIVDSTITGNSTWGGGRGGGVSGGNVRIESSLIANNVAEGFQSRGGGVFMTSGTVSNSTIFANQVIGDFVRGGGVSGGTIENSTVTGNVANGSSGSYGGASSSVVNSIVVGNRASTAFSNDLGNFTGTGNLIGGLGVTADTVFTTAQNLTAGFTTVRTGVLADNGGPTPTVAIGANSLAIDAALGGPATDQRGVARVDARAGGGTIDVGAFEFQTVLEAGSLVVTTTADVVNGTDGLTSLREAVMFANSNPGVDTVTFAAGLVGETIHLNAEIRITEDIIIDGELTGDQLPDITIDANADGDLNAATPPLSTASILQARRAFTATDTGVDATFDGLTITGGRTSGSGGAIEVALGTATIINSVITGNRAEINGGGVSARTLVVTNSEIVENRARSNGGGLNASMAANVDGSRIARNDSNQSGGGLSANVATISSSEFADNSALGQGGGVSASGNVTATDSAFIGNRAGSGGGLNVNSVMTLVNVTLAGNSTTGSSGVDGLGGGAYAGDAALLNATTVTGNIAGRRGGGLWLGGGTSTINNSIILGNRAPDSADIRNTGGALTGSGNIIGGPALPAQVFAALTDLGAGFFGGTAADNGGLTRTVALAADGSNPAIDGANALAPVADQRGLARVDLVPGGGVPDIGAFELQDSGPGIIRVGTGPSVLEGAPGPGGTLLFTIERSGGLGGSATVTYALAAGTADAADLVAGLPQPGSVIFAPGETTKTVAVAIAGDTDVEPDETIVFNLTGVTGATLDLATVTGVIRNDDAPPPAIISAGPGPIANEGGPGPGGVLVFTATRSGSDLSGAASVAFTIAGVGANPADAADLAPGQSLGGSFTFAAGQTSASFSVNIAGDTIVEANETLELVLNAPIGATLGTDRATGTIVNDDFVAPPIVQVAPGQRVAEGDPGDLNAFTFTITRANNTTGTTNVTYQLEGSFDPLVDLRGAPPLTDTVTFAPGESTKTVTVPIEGDLVDEPDDTVILRLTGADGGARIGLNTATAVIVNDDAPAFVSITGGSTIEGDGVGAPNELVFVATRTGNTLKSMTIDVTIGLGTAGAVDIALPAPRTLTFAPGQTTQEVRVGITGDVDNEADETVTATLSNPGAPLSILGGGTATATIVNDDGPARFNIAVLTGTVAEGNAGAAAPNVLRFEIRRDLNIKAAAEVDLVLSGAADATDFVGVTPGTPIRVSFAANELTREVVVPILGDTVIEANEFVVATLANPTANAQLGSTISATAVIADDDVPAFLTIVPSLSRGAVEGGALIMTVVRSGNTAGTVSATYAVTGVSAGASPADLAGPRTGIVSFTPGETIKSIAIATADDSLREIRESFTLSLNSPSAGAGINGRGAVVDIIDNDGPTPPPPPPPNSLIGRNFGDPHLVTLDGLGYDFMAAGEFTLVEATSGAPLLVQARFVPVPGSDVVTQTAAIATVAGGVRLMIDIAAATPVLVGGVPTPLDSGSAVAVGDGMLYRVGDTFTFVYASGEQLEVILRDGFLDVGVALAADRANNIRGLLGDADGDASNDLQLPDGAVLVAADISFDLLYGAYASGWRITDAQSLFTYPAGLGTADFTDLDFPRAAISVDTLPDAIVAEAEALLDALGVTDPAAREAAIIDFALTGNRDFIDSAADAEDAAPVSERAEPAGAPAAAIVGVSAQTSVVGEGDSGVQIVRFTVFRTSATGTLDVVYALGGGPGRADAADLSPTDAVAGTMSFAVGETERELAFTVLGDTVIESDEALRLQISLAPDASALVGAASAETLIVDDDAPFASLAVTSGTIAEGAPDETAALTFTVTRTGDTTGAANVDYTLGGGTADAADLALGLQQSGTLVFAPGETTRTVAVAIAGDLAVEADETLVLTLSNPSDGTALATAVATGNIANDDSRFTIATLAADRAEGGTGTTPFTFTITRTGNTSAAQSVGFAVTGLGGAPADAADFAGTAFPTGTAGFAPGQASTTITVDVAGDFILELDERFAVTLTPPVGTTVGAPAEGMIRTDDTRYAIAAIDSTLPEGNSGTAPLRFIISREGNLAAATASFAVTGTGPTPADAADFAGSALPTGTAVFAAGQTSAEIMVQVSGDSVIENDETFAVTLAPPTGATIGAATASATIINDDVAGDTVIGTPGPDVLTGNAIGIQLIGLAGDDRYIVISAGDRVTEAAGEGTDTVETSLAAYTLDPNVENLRYTGSAGFSGIGNDLKNLIAGGAGNDTLAGLGDDDVVQGNGGDDSIDGGAGNDLLDGGPGIDTVSYGSAASGVTVNLSARNAQNTAGAGTDRLSNFENLLGSAFDDILLGDAFDNLVVGGAGNDRILSARGNDTLDGGDGNDLLQGGVDTDTFRFDKVSNGAMDIVTDLNLSEGDKLLFGPGITVVGVEVSFLSTPEVVDGFVVNNSARSLDLVLELQSVDGVQTVYILDAYNFGSNPYWESVLGLELNYPRPLPVGTELLPIA